MRMRGSIFGDMAERAGPNQLGNSPNQVGDSPNEVAPNSNQATWQRIADRIQEKAAGSVGPCPVCHHNQFILGSTFTPLSGSESPTGASLGGRVYPMQPLICSTCGNTFLLNLVFLFSEAELAELTLTPQPPA
jgi:hypothetical protein